MNCGERVFPVKLKEHEEACENKIVCCSAKDVMCNWTGPKKDLSHHLGQCHFVKLAPVLSQLLSIISTLEKRVRLLEVGTLTGHTEILLGQDRDLVIEAMNQNALALEFVSFDFQDDKEVVLAAVKRDGYTLQFASDELRDDKEVVSEAVKNYGNALQFASDRLKDDKEVVSEASFNSHQID